MPVKQRPALEGPCKSCPEVCPSVVLKRYRQGGTYINSSVKKKNFEDFGNMYVALHILFVFHDSEVARQD